MNKLMNKRKMWLFPLFFIGIFLAASGLVMFLWNSILPTLFSGVGLLSFSHAMGLLVLCRLLFGSFKRAITETTMEDIGKKNSET